MNTRPSNRSSSRPIDQSNDPNTQSNTRPSNRSSSPLSSRSSSRSSSSSSSHSSSRSTIQSNNRANYIPTDLSNSFSLQNGNTSTDSPDSSQDFYSVDELIYLAKDNKFPIFILHLVQRKNLFIHFAFF